MLPSRAYIVCLRLPPHRSPNPDGEGALLVGSLGPPVVGGRARAEVPRVLQVLVAVAMGHRCSRGGLWERTQRKAGEMMMRQRENAA